MRKILLYQRIEKVKEMDDTLYFDLTDTENNYKNFKLGNKKKDATLEEKLNNSTFKEFVGQYIIRQKGEWYYVLPFTRTFKCRKIRDEIYQFLKSNNGVSVNRVVEMAKKKMPCSKNIKGFNLHEVKLEIGKEFFDQNFKIKENRIFHINQESL